MIGESIINIPKDVLHTVMGIIAIVINFLLESRKRNFLILLDHWKVMEEKISCTFYLLFHSYY